MSEKTIDLADYVEQTAQLLDLPLAPEHQDGVIENFIRIAAIAQLVTEFALPEDIEVAPVFKP